MERFTHDDATFFDLEDEVSAMHNVTVAVFEGPEPGFGEFTRRVASRIALVPRLRQRVAEIPFGIGRPVWIDDPQFSLDYHLRHTALPTDGGEGDSMAPFRNLVGRLQSQRLDRGKPLWEMWMVSGLPERRFAIVSKAHYAMVDGVSGTDPLALITDQAKGPRRADRWEARPRPSDRDLFLRAATELAFRPTDQVRVMRRAVVAPVARAVRMFTSVSGSGAPASLVGAVSPHRRWHQLEIEGADVRRLRDGLDVATNDVLLGLVTWGLRTMLIGRPAPKSSPADDRSLAVVRALVPLAVATGDHFTNEMSALEADLPVGVDNVSLAIQLISDQTRHAAGRRKAVAGATLADAQGLNAPTLCALGLRTATRAGVRLRSIHTVVVNAPGPRNEISVLDRTMAGLFPAIPLVSRVRTSVGIMSYGDRYYFGITGDRDTAVEIESIANGIAEALRS